MKRLFVTNEKSDNRFFQYVLGFQPSDGAMIVDDQEKTIEVTLLLDGRYIDREPLLPPEELQARFGKPVEIKKVQRKKSLDDMIQELVPAGEKLTIQKSISLSTAMMLKETYELVDEGDRSTATRTKKTPWELEQIRTAMEMSEELFARIDEQIKKGALLEKTEGVVRGMLFQKALEMGFEDEAFPAIVATGKNSASPHHKSSSDPIAPGPLLIDAGYRFKGYCSDCTRCRRIGEKNEQVGDREKVLHRVQHAQQLAKETIAPGKKAQDIDAVARSYLDLQGVGTYFTHSLGHGVGLDIHEGPRLGPESEDSLEEGMVVTVEPGVYLPGQFGVRREDVVIISNEKLEMRNE